MKKIYVLLIIGAFFVSLPETIAQTVKATVTPATIMANPEEIITVTIEIDMSGSTEVLGSFSGSLNWNASFLDYQSNGGIMSGFTGAVNDGSATSGQLFFNGANPAGAPDVVPVLEVTFKVGTMGAILDLDFSAMAAALTFVDLLPDLEIQDGDIVLDAEDLQFADKEGVSFQALSLPGNQGVLFRVNIPEQGGLIINVYNMVGSLATVLTNSELTNGSHEFIWNAGNYPTGIYLAQIRFQDKIFTRKFLLKCM